MSLDGCRIFAAAERASFVDQAIEDLLEWTGGRLIENIQSVDGGTVVLVGKEAVRQAAEGYPELAEVGLDGLSDQGFLLQTVHGSAIDFVICSGGGPRGDAYAVIELIKSTDGDLAVPEISRREEPYFIRRGMYAHQHWAYNYPYALRSWKFEDWKHYIDLLAYMKINFFSIWSMAGICPDPLSEGDREYLENYRRVIDYAKNRRGMEVFIGECANNVAESHGDKPIQQRDYFDVEILKNPADPKEFCDIMDNRRNLYKVADNADGYWIIDSDPGGYPGSPASEFVDILVGNSELIDEHTKKGRSAKLAYWMWVGWDNGGVKGNCGAVVEDMRERLKEPWVLFACWPGHLDTSRDLGFMDKTLFFPYGIIEDEPSPPTTRLRFDEMHGQLNNLISTWGCRSVMGNAQSPVVQLPNIFFLAQSAWDGVAPSLPSNEGAVTPLARLIAPDIAGDLALGWLMLSQRNSCKVFACAEKLERIAEENRFGRLGSLGRWYFPGVGRLLRDLALQLRVHGRAMELVEKLTTREPAEQVEEAMFGYYDAALTWQEVHDFRRYHCYGPDVREIDARWRDYRAESPMPEEYTARLKRRLLEAGHSEWGIDGYVALTPPGPRSS